jgi:hypothetical protein
MSDRTAPTDDPSGSDAFSVEDTDPVGFAPILPWLDEDAVDRESPVAGDPVAAPAEPPPHRPRRRALIAVVAAALLLGLASVTVIVANTGGERPVDGSGNGVWSGRPSAAAPQSGKPLTGPRQGRRTASFALADGTSDLRVHAADLGDDLYRISVPAGSARSPQVRQQDGAVTLFLPARAAAAGAVDVVLNSGVQWSVNIIGGTDDSVIDMTGAAVSEVDLTGGSARIDVTLPRPSRPVTVRMTGGVNRFAVHLAASTPVRVQVGAGAGQLTIGGRTHNGIAPGQSFTANGWLDGRAGVDVQAVGGMAAFSVM